MNRAFVIKHYPFAPGNLNRALAERITAYLEALGYETRCTPPIWRRRPNCREHQNQLWDVKNQARPTFREEHHENTTYS